MKLVGMHIVNFGIYEDQDFELFDLTVIRARNGSGKSTIQRAVEWCLYGTELSKKNQDQKLLHRDATEMEVTTTWESDMGDCYVITRTKPASGPIVVTVNRKKAKPGQIEGLFGEVKEFLSVFQPGFFSSEEPREAKSILANCLPIVSIEDVIKRCTHKELIENEKFGMGIDSVDIAAKKVREEIKERTQELTRLEGEERVYTDAIEEGKPEAPTSRITDDRRAKYTEAKAEVNRLQEEYKNRPSTIRALCLQRDTLRATYSMVKKTLGVADTKCHSCGQDLPAEKAEQIRGEIEEKNASINKQLVEIKEQGEKLTVDINRLEALPTQLEVDQKILSAISQFEADEAEDRAEVAKYQAALTQYDKAVKELERVRQDKQAETKGIEQLQLKLDALKDFGQQYIRLQNAKLDELFNKVRIRLTDYNKETGEIKSVFRIEWDGKPYKSLSLSERVRCDLEIGRVIQTPKLESMTVFVDNAESVQDLYSETFSGQLIAAYVSDVAGMMVQSHDEAARNIQEETRDLLVLLRPDIGREIDQLLKKVGA